MHNKRFFAALCALALLLTILPASTLAEESDSWWQGDIWDTAALTALGALPPVYNADTKQYEISTPEQLLYLSGTWKPEDTNADGAPDAPCDGVYVLTADLDMQPLMERIGQALTSLSGTAAEGYMPPIAALTDEGQDGGVNCAFFGTFDGQGHVISNLRIERMQSKYAGLFGNVGHDLGEGTVRNLALFNIEIKCLASGGLLVGGLYGDVENCVVIGSIDCLEKTAGGIAGKVKKNDNGYLGTVSNCFVYADILVRGEGDENGAAGGVTSAQSDGGRIYNCIVGGSITVLGEKADSVGGITGNLKSGQALENTLMCLKKIDVNDGANIGLLCGDYAGETGSHLLNNYVWNGTVLSGGVSSDHPETAAFTTVDAAAIQTKSFYADTLGWDFETLWTWIGEDDSGYPMLKQFTGTGGVLENLGAAFSSNLSVTEPVLRLSEPMTTKAYAGDEVPVTCTLVLPEGVTASLATLRYGTEKDASAFTDSVPMADNGDNTFTAVFPLTEAGEYYYSVEAVAGGKTLLFPNQAGASVRLDLVSPEAKYQPKQLTVSPGANPTKVGFAWITDEGEGSVTAKLRYRKAGGSDWITADVIEIYSDNVGSGKTLVSYSVDLAGLTPGTQYEYRAVTQILGKEYQTETKTFTTLPDGNAFSCLLVSDLQATNEEGYLPFLSTMDSFVNDQLGGTNFVISLGDMAEDGSSLSQWRFMFQTLGDYFATHLTAFVPGNHEAGSDAGYTIFDAETNLPGGANDPALLETTGSFIAGDVCFVILNTEPYSGEQGADVVAEKAAFYQMEKDYAKQAFESSGCRWRVIVAHAGLIQDDPTATAFLESMCDELNVDLYFNGHIHNYYRACARGGVAAETGEGTTFITTSPMGLKFDDFVGGVIDDLLQFQTGGSADKRPYFTRLVADDNGLIVTAYQLSEASDLSKASSFSSYSVIDTITLTQSLSERYAAPVSAPAPAEEQTAVTVFAWWKIAAIGGAALLVVLAVVLITKKRKAKPENQG